MIASKDYQLTNEIINLYKQIICYNVYYKGVSLTILNMYIILNQLKKHKKRPPKNNHKQMVCLYCKAIEWVSDWC